MTIHALKNEPSATLETLRDALPDFAKDIRLNLGTVLTPEGAPELSVTQIFSVALASAYATRNANVMQAISSEAALNLSEAEITSAKAAASVMAMNNVYYRFLHLVGDAEFKTMPAKLRMNVIANPGVPKIDFELMSLAVSAINGCGMCIEAHTHELLKQGASKLAIQSTVRIAAVISAAAQAITIAE